MYFERHNLCYDILDDNKKWKHKNSSDKDDKEKKINNKNNINDNEKSFNASFNSADLHADHVFKCVKMINDVSIDEVKNNKFIH